MLVRACLEIRIGTRLLAPVGLAPASPTAPSVVVVPQQRSASVPVAPLASLSIATPNNQAVPLGCVNYSFATNSSTMCADYSFTMPPLNIILYHTIR